MLPHIYSISSVLAVACLVSACSNDIPQNSENKHLHSITQTNELLIGRWQSDEDTQMKIDINTEWFITSYDYGGLTLHDSDMYSISHRRCDADKDSASAIFIHLSTNCYQLTGIDNKQMELILRTGAQSHIFTKLRQ